MRLFMQTLSSSNPNAKQPKVANTKGMVLIELFLTLAVATSSFLDAETVELNVTPSDSGPR